MWVHAIFVSPEVATTLGIVYVCLRACYPVVWALADPTSGKAPKAAYTWLLFGKTLSIYYCTYPQYGIIVYMVVANALSLGLDFDLNALVIMPALVAPILFGLSLFHFSLGLFPFLQIALKPLFTGNRSFQSLGA